MADVRPTARLRIVRQGGREDRWRFELAADAPLDNDQLKRELLQQFDEGADADNYDLTVKGTLAAPEFILTERRKGIASNVQRDD
jgi:hypothetical protein